MAMEPGNGIVIPDATEEPEAYVKTLLELLGDGEPLEVLFQTEREVARLISDLPEDVLTKPAKEGEWSTAQLLGHLLDVEVVYGFRWRLVLTEKEPSYPGYNEKTWALLPKPVAREIFAGWKHLRRINLVLLSETPRADWQRTGVHGEQGEETFEKMVQKLAGHDLAHLDQLVRTVVAVQESPRGEANS
ncbi:MAG: DinB family protein [Actinomycetota bacterium]